MLNKQTKSARAITVDWGLNSTRLHPSKSNVMRFCMHFFPFKALASCSTWLKGCITLGKTAFWANVLS